MSDENPKPMPTAEDLQNGLRAIAGLLQKIGYNDGASDAVVLAAGYASGWVLTEIEALDDPDRRAAVSQVIPIMYAMVDEQRKGQQ